MKQGNRRKGQEERRQENRDITVAAAYEEVFKPRLAGYSGETAEFYDYAVGTFARWWGGRSLAELTKEDVYRYFAWLRTKSLSPASLNTLGRGLKTFIVYLEEEGYVEGSFARLELPRWGLRVPIFHFGAQAGFGSARRAALAGSRPGKAGPDQLGRGSFGSRAGPDAQEGREHRERRQHPHHRGERRRVAGETRHRGPAGRYGVQGRAAGAGPMRAA